MQSAQKKSDLLLSQKTLTGEKSYYVINAISFMLFKDDLGFYLDREGHYKTKNRSQGQGSSHFRT